ncbi:MAG: TRAP transporter large permease subunit [Candidatus Marinimicrobia bacterium]|nr:TRAP transporter large permease subunit [Candidatus Neomarinimicrobiota bacterium]
MNTGQALTAEAAITPRAKRPGTGHFVMVVMLLTLGFFLIWPVILLLINVLLLMVGTFMDITPAVLIFTPIFLPVVTQLGMDPIHFGIMIVLNLCIGLCTPPVGNVLFVGCSIANTTITKVIRPLLPLFLAMIFSLLLVTFIPSLSLFLPRLFGF